MLTSGEYVVRKKIVDKIGVNELNKINQTGSLEELYDKPNEDNFELFETSDMVSPPIMRFRDGGSLKNYLQPQNKNQQEYSTDGIQSSIESLSGVIERFAGGMVFLNAGRRPQDQRLRPTNKDRAYANIGAGAGMMAGTALGKMAFGKDKNNDNQGPTAPRAPQSLNTRSRLDIDPTGRQMSARYRREDSYSKDYGRYLLDKYQHDVDTRNQKQMERAQQIGAIASTVTMMAGMAIGNKLTQGPKPTVDDLEAKVEKDSSGFKKITRGDHNLNQHQRMARAEAARNNTSNFSHSQSFQNYEKNQNSSSIAGGFSSSYAYNNMVGAYTRGGQVYNHSYFNQGGSVYSPYSYFYNGGRVNSSSYASNSISKMSEGGMVHGLVVLIRLGLLCLTKANM